MINNVYVNIVVIIHEDYYRRNTRMGTPIIETDIFKNTNAVFDC